MIIYDDSATNVKEKIELKVTTYLLPYSMMIVKKNNKVSYIKVDMYSVDSDFMNRRSFIINEKDKENVEFFSKQWERIWASEKSTLIDEKTDLDNYISNIQKNDKQINIKSEYTGIWETEIKDEFGKTKKRDELKLVEREGEIVGEMKRIFPNEQRDREWFVHGYVKNSHILLTVVSKKERQCSDGSVYVVLDGDNVYSGAYLKNVDNKVATIPITLRYKHEL